MHLAHVAIHPERFPVADMYPFNLSIFHEARTLEFTRPVTMFVGENGTGKSTLLEATARACGIHIWVDEEEIRYDRNPHESSFYRYVNVSWTNGPVPGSFFGAGIFRQFARLLDDWARADPGQLQYFGGKSLMTMSHGQSLMAYFRNRYRIRGLYLLDEPEAALSPKTQLELLDLLSREGAAGEAQFIIATHSPILLACPGALIYSFDGERIEPTKYEDTGHYRLYRKFFTDRDPLPG